MAGVESAVEALVRTFGPFLIPVTVFGIGAVGYTVLFLLSRQFRGDDADGVVNLSAGTPERSTTDKDHGATGRGVLPDDLVDTSAGKEGADDGAEGDDGSEGDDDTTGTEDSPTGLAPEDPPRHND
jgi:hypothetical protein